MPSPFQTGDLIEIWSNSNQKWAPGTILDHVDGHQEVMDRGHPVPIGSLKVEYKGGPNSYACKWVLPGDVMRMVRYPKTGDAHLGEKRGNHPNSYVSGSGDGKMRCKMECGRYVQPGLTRNLNQYETCCKKCASSHGNGQHDANCQGAFIDGTTGVGRSAPMQGPGWGIKEIQKILDDPRELQAKSKEAIEKFGNGGNDIKRENCKEFFNWLEFKAGSKRMEDENIAEVFTQFADDKTALTQQATEKLIHTTLRKTYDSLYGPKKLNLERSMFVRQNDQVVKNVYMFGKKIGEGSFGKVYLVEHQMTKERRVCKGIMKKGSSVPIQQILDEILIMSQLDHPNILKIYEYFIDPNAIYLVMEVCAGGELLARIKSGQKTLAQKGIEHHERWIHDTMKQTLRALSFMHGRRVAHKDLKPENILYTSEESNTLKVIDFGLAEWFKQSQRYSDLQCGTPLYCAPEIFANLPFDYRVDLWSSGVIMFYMITGYLPFLGKDLAEVKGKVCGKDPPPTPVIKQGSSLMQDLCLQMLTKNAASRPTAPQCLSHKWFVVMGEQETKLSPGIIQSLQNFNQQNELKKSVNFYIAHTCSLPQLEQIRELFTNLDENNDGTLNQTTLRGVLIRAGMCPYEAAAVVHGISRNGNNLGAPISYTEFIAATSSVRVSTKQPELLDFAFSVFDKSNTGLLTVDDFSKVFGDSNMSNDAQSTLGAAFTEMDSEKTGKVSKQQFHKYMKRLGKMGMGDNFSAV